MNSGWPHGCAQRPSRFIGQPEATDEETGLTGGSHHIVRNGIEPELGPSEHPERVGRLDDPPGDVDEPLAWRPLDLRPPKVYRRGWRDDLAIEVPYRRDDVGRSQTQEVSLPFAALYGHVDVVMAVGEVRSGPAAQARQVEALDPDKHIAIVARAIASLPKRLRDAG